MNIRIDPYAFAFVIVMHFFIVPWLMKHARKPRPDLPPSIKAAANILLTTGGVFTITGVVLGIFFMDMARTWRFMWVATASIGGAVWIWNAFRLRDGISAARWTSIPFLLASFFCLPLLGWITAPISFYCLFLNKRARQFFKERKELPHLE